MAPRRTRALCFFFLFIFIYFFGGAGFGYLKLHSREAGDGGDKEQGRTFQPPERREMKHFAITRSRGKGAKRRYI